MGHYDSLKVEEAPPIDGPTGKVVPFTKKQPKPAKAFVVTRGDYDDYQVVAVFSTKKNAQAFMGLLSDERDFRLETYTLDPDYPEIREGLDYYYVRMLKTGDVEAVRKQPRDDYTWRYPNCKPHLHKSRNLLLDDAIFCNSVIAKDEQHAIKIVAEQMFQFIAEGRWK